MRFRRPGRRIVAAALLATVLAVLSGCGGDGDASRSGQVTIDFLSYNYGTPDIGGKGTQELILDVVEFTGDGHLLNCTGPQGAWTASLPGREQPPSVGSRVHAYLHPERVHLFDASTGERLAGAGDKADLTGRDVR
jgi:hypothetical protein